MKRFQIMWFCWMTAFALVLPGCNFQAGPVSPPPTVTPEQLFHAWQELPKAGQEQMDIATAMQLTQQLANLGGDALHPLFQVIGDDAGDPVAKMLAVMCLTAYTNETHVSLLRPMIEPGRNVTTRVCALTLLWPVCPPDLLERIKQLTADPERQVRVVAAFALIQREDPEGLSRVDALWADPETTRLEREQLVLIIPENAAAQHMPVFKDAASTQNLTPPARQRAILLLGRFGDASVTDALRACAEKDPNPDIRSLAQSAVDAILARTGGAEPPPVPAPAASAQESLPSSS